MMQVTRTAIADVLRLKPKVFEDGRGFFFESFNERESREATGVTLPFVQDNHSKSGYGVLRELHYQTQNPQGKLVRVAHGVVFDVAADIRPESLTYVKWVGEVLSASNKRQLWIPPGLAHGFLVLSETAESLYKTTDYYAPAFEKCIAWNDPTFAIEWPAMSIAPKLSAKDMAGDSFPSV